MFGNEEELKNSIPNSMRISIINPTPQKNDLSQRILDKTGPEYKERLKFTCTSNYKDIYKDLDKLSFQKDAQTSNGLINIKWIDDLCNRRPSLIIYYHHIPNGSNKSLEEKKIYENLVEIKKYDELVYIFLFIISKDMKENPYNFNSEDEKQYNLRNLISKECIFVFPDEDIWRMLDFNNFCNNIIHYSRLYYRRYKTKIKERKVKATTREEKIECNIKLAVLSIIKTKKIAYNQNKYLDEAYDLISDKNYKRSNYLYGIKPTNVKYNLSEVRAVSDWLFFKIMKLASIKPSTPIQPQNNNKKSMSRSLTNSLLGQQQKTIKNMDFDSQIKRYQNHIQIFSYLDKYIKDNKDDKFIFIEYYWLIKRYKDLCDLYEENLKTSSNNKKLLSLGIVYLKQIYYYIKMIKFFKKNKAENLNSILIKNKEVPINIIEIVFSQFYGKPPSYSYKDIHNPLMKFELGFDENIYFKKFISDQKLNVEGSLNELYNQYLSKTTNLFQTLKNSSSKKGFIGGIDLYLNMLKILLLSNNEKENNVFNISNFKMEENLLKILETLPNINVNNIKKFPKIYLHYLELSINSLIYDMQNKDISNFSKTKLFTNLSLLGNLRKLNENEEKIYFQLINDEGFIPVDVKETKNGENNEPKPLVINLNREKDNENAIFDFEYNLKNEDGNESQTKKILDLVEYNFKIKTYLSKEKMKLNSVKVYFQSVNEDVEKKQKREIIVKEYNKEELNNFDLSVDSPVNLEHKLFMKYKKGKIYLTQVEITLCKKENITYKIELSSDINKMIFITNLDKRVLNIKIPKEKITVGTNQLNKFEFVVNKEEYNEVQIAKFKMNFMSIPSYYKKVVPNTSMKALLNTKSTQPKPSAAPQSNISQQIFGLPNNKKVNHKKELSMSIMPPDRSSLPNSKTSFSNNNLPNLKNANTLGGTSMQNFFYNNNNNNNNDNEQNEFTKSSNNLYKSQMFPSPTVPVNPQQTPTKNSNLSSEVIQAALPSPEFYSYNDENKTLDKTEKNYEKEYDNFESMLKNKNKYGVLIKFLQAGQYEIKLNITYSIRHREIEDYIEFTQEETLKVIVIDPFKFCNEVNSNNFLILTKIKEDKNEVKNTEFLTNRDIQMNLILTNQLNEDVIIKDIIIQLNEENLNEKNKNIEVKSPIKDIVNSQSLPSEIKNQILKILKSADYNIPFETKFIDKFKGSIGKIILKWSTPSLIDYECGDLSLVNENTFDFPTIVVNSSELNYNYETTIDNNKDVLFNIKISNVSEKCKKIIFMIENGEDINFIVSGSTKQVLSIKAKEIMNVAFRLIPLIHNVELKLPKLKISEMNYNSQEKLWSNYYFPEKINIS